MRKLLNKFKFLQLQPFATSSEPINCKKNKEHGAIIVHRKKEKRSEVARRAQAIGYVGRLHPLRIFFGRQKTARIRILLRSRSKNRVNEFKASMQEHDGNSYVAG